MQIIAALNLPYTAELVGTNVNAVENEIAIHQSRNQSRKQSLVHPDSDSDDPKPEVPFDFAPEPNHEISIPEELPQIHRTAPNENSAIEDSTDSERSPSLLMRQLESTSFQTGLNGVSPGDYDTIYETDRLQVAKLHRRRSSSFGTASLAEVRKRFSRHNSATSLFGMEDPDVEIVECQSSNTGLYNAITSAIDNKVLSEVKYVGLPAVPSDELSLNLKKTISKRLLDEKNCYAAFVTDKQRKGHYDGYCKEFLYPTFHCQIPDIPTAGHYEGYCWDDYVAVNRAVADQVIHAYEEGDSIWVHDYHLMLVPFMVRETLPNVPIGFFMHVAFPSSEVFRCLAYRAELLSGILAANLVGFHIPEYAHHFKMSLARILAVDITGPGIVETAQNDTFILSYPLGINTDELDLILRKDDPKSTVQQHRKVIRKRWPTQKIIASRDKLDPIRGLHQKMRAFDHFLSENPDWVDKVVLVQICTSVGEEMFGDTSLETLVDQINSKYGDIASGIQPIVLLKQDVKFEQYLALLSEADGFCVSCLRDGMNLTSHEFVHCNDNERMGPLILSEFTGSASVIGEGALIINPWNQKQLANAFKTCVEMPKEERKRNWDILQRQISENQSYKWVEVLVSRLSLTYESKIRQQCQDPDIEHLQQVYHSTKDNEKRVFFLELERPESDKGREIIEQQGGHTKPRVEPITSDQVGGDSKLIAPTSPGSTYFSTRLPRTVGDLVYDKRNQVYVVSAESRNHMDRMYRSIPGVGLIAEFGRFIKFCGSEEWIELKDTRDYQSWHDSLQPWVAILEERSLVSKITRTDSTISIKFNISDDPSYEKRDLSTIGEYLSLINDHYARELGVRTKHEGHTVTLYRSDIGVSREQAYQYVIDKINAPLALTLVASQQFASDADDLLFRWAQDLKEAKKTKEAFGILLGHHSSLAQYKVEGTNALLSLLQRMHTLEEPRETSSRVQINDDKHN